MLDGAWTARRRQPVSLVDMAGLGVRVVSDMDRSLQGVLKKRNWPNARQRRHRRAARSPVEDMPFVHLIGSSGYLCGIHARTAWSHNEGC